MLDGALDANRDIKLGRDGLPGTAHLPLHRQPAIVANGPRRGCSAPRASAIWRPWFALVVLSVATSARIAAYIRDDFIYGLGHRKISLDGELRGRVTLFRRVVGLRPREVTDQELRCPAFSESQPRPMRSMRSRAGAARRPRAVRSSFCTSFLRHHKERDFAVRATRRGARRRPSGRIAPGGCWRAGSAVRQDAPNVSGFAAPCQPKPDRVSAPPRRRLTADRCPADRPLNTHATRPDATAPLGRRDTALARPGPAPCVWRCAAVLRARQRETRKAIAIDALRSRRRVGWPSRRPWRRAADGPKGA
jgi:hypothetical protein